MYESFFGLSKNPFAMTPDPGALFMTPAHREALAGLSYAIIRRKGFVVLVGEAGTGKTTLLRRFLEMGPETNARTSMVVNPTLTPDEFLELLLENFGVSASMWSKARRLVQIERLLTEAHEHSQIPVLIIDEAHKLSFDVLEEIRLLTNFETSEHKLLQIVLAGQPELGDLMRHPELRQLKQRMAVRLTISPLKGNEISAYLSHRWTRVSSDRELPFDSQAVSLIAYWSQGIPRLINSICDNALLLAFSEGSREVSPTHILEVVRDLDLTAAPAEELTTPSLEQEEDSPIVQVEDNQIQPIVLRSLDRYMPESPRPFFRWWQTTRA